MRFNLNKITITLIISVMLMAEACVSSGYYTPDIDLFIFRHDSSKETTPIGQEGFEIDGQNNIVNYLYNFFSTADTSINPFQKQNQMLFYKSKIRAFIVTPHRGVDTTYLGNYTFLGNHQIQCEGQNAPFTTSFTDAGIDPDRVILFKDRDIYTADLAVAGFLLSDLALDLQRKLYLTNQSGTDITGGAEVAVARDNLRIFFSDRISPCNEDTEKRLDSGPAGLASIGSSRFLNPTNRILSSASAIASRYNQSIRTNDSGDSYLFGLGDTTQNLRVTISHELGHIFGLKHSFDEASCDTQNEGTTARIMDYFDPNRQNVGPPSIFINCEQEKYKELSDVFLDREKIDYDLDSNGKPKDGSNPQIQTMQSALYRSLSTDNQLAVVEGRLEIIDSTTNPALNSNEELKKETISLKGLPKLRYVP